MPLQSVIEISKFIIISYETGEVENNLSEKFSAIMNWLTVMKYLSNGDEGYVPIVVTAIPSTFLRIRPNE